MPVKAILYARKSPHNLKSKGVVMQSESIEWQFERMECFAKSLDLEVVGRESDWLKSGKTTKGRDGLEKAIAQAIRVKGYLVVYDWSRLSRDVGDGLSILRRLKKGHADLRSVVDGVATDTADGELIFSIKLATHQYQRRLGAEKTADAMKRHQTSGRSMGRPDRAPFGFRAVPATNAQGEAYTALENDPNEQATIIRIRQLAIVEKSHRAICRRLDEEGYPRRGKTWKNGHGLISSILARA
jgi:DNA invertase Pin-like site-specific DNA recombinase